MRPSNTGLGGMSVNLLKDCLVLDLNDVRYFVQVVDSGGLTAASRSTGIPKSTLSHRLQQLEAGLGVRLVNRTSRAQTLTEAGSLFYRHALVMLQSAEMAENSVRQRLDEPTGVVKFTTAIATSMYVLRHIIPQFAIDHPKINLVQHTGDEQTDIIGGAFDLAIRAHEGQMTDSALVQRTLSPAPWFIFAAPCYLQHRGEPTTPDDLLEHDLLAMYRPGQATVWKLSHPLMGDRSLAVQPRMAGNDLMMLKQAAADGIGITALPGYICREELLEGKLQRVMPEWLAGKAVITAVLPFRDYVLPSVRAFLDYLIIELPKVVNPDPGSP
ncbi:LysR substrate-binding domain-containing protein [Rhizobium sp. 23-156Da]